MIMSMKTICNLLFMHLIKFGFGLALILMLFSIIFLSCTQKKESSLADGELKLINELTIYTKDIFDFDILNKKSDKTILFVIRKAECDCVPLSFQIASKAVRYGAKTILLGKNSKDFVAYQDLIDQFPEGSLFKDLTGQADRYGLLSLKNTLVIHVENGTPKYISSIDGSTENQINTYFNWESK